MTIQLEQVLDAVRRLPDRPTPVPSPALAAFLARGEVQVEILDTRDELGARRARRGLFAAKVALAATCLTVTGVAAAGAVTGVGPVPRLPVLERHAPATPAAPKIAKPVSHKVSPTVRPTPAPAVAVHTSKPQKAQPDDDRPVAEARHQRRDKGFGTEDRFRRWGDQDQPKRWPGRQFRHDRDERPGHDGRHDRHHRDHDRDHDRHDGRHHGGHRR